MAASDQHYRNQKALDILFGISCVAMLLTIAWMFAQDYFKDFKSEQRVFRDVETAVAERDLAEQLFHMMHGQDFLGPYGEAYAAVEDAKEKIQAFSKDPARSAELQAANAELAEAQTKLKEAEAGLPSGFDKFLGTYTSIKDDINAARKAVEDAKKEHAEAIHKAEVNMAAADAAYRGKKAVYDSKESLYYIAVDEARTPDAVKELEGLKTELNRLRDERDELKGQVDKRLRELQEAQKTVTAAENALVNAEKVEKEKKKQLELYQKLVKAKQWSIADEILASPVIDMFNSPYKIQQYTLTELPIDYSFKYVTRYDRCTTCHQGMEKEYLDKELLESLTHSPKATEAKLRKFRELLVARENAGQPTGGFKSSDLPAELKKLPDSTLTPYRVKQFAAHPRLDLFVHPNSPHSADKFGCTICHGGQGSATDFKNADHTPNNPHQKEKWAKTPFEGGLGWEHIHFWDYPMLPSRFTESSCLKCHHQVTDLIRYGSKEEAPKLIEGFNLVRENGCFGCHEISGMKSVKGDMPYSRPVGPDMRLEPGIPLDHLPPAERAKLLADVANPPGTMRKVGPSLYRLNDKTHPEWLAQWIHDPRGFRPTTKMPHFYGTSNNSPEELARTAPDQANFPDAEIQSIVAYLTHESGEYLLGKNRDAYRRPYLARLEQLRITGTKGLEKPLVGMDEHLELVRLKSRGDSVLSEADRRRIAELEGSVKTTLEEIVKDGNFKLTDAEKKEFMDIVKRLRRESLPTLELRDPFPSAAEMKDKLTDHEGREITLPPTPDAAAKASAVNRGARLFTERGCLACHQHSGPAADEDTNARRDRATYKATADATAAPLSPVQSEAHFGPDLSRLKEKLGTKKGDAESARRWLVQWLLNPNIHFPRTRMPVTFLNEPDKDGNLPANDIALYLLDKSEEWLPSILARVKAILDKVAERPDAISEKEQEALDEAEKVVKTNLQQGLPKLLRAAKAVSKLTPEEQTRLAALDAELTSALPVPAPGDDTLKRLTAVYLGRVRPRKDVESLLRLEPGGDQKALITWLRNLKADSDEAILAGLDSPEMQSRLKDASPELDKVILGNATNPENMKRYIGRKAIMRQGCYGCHNIPGFEQAKPVGTALNDWGKKDPERLAFEDAPAYVEEHYNVIDEVVSFNDLETKLRAILKSPDSPQAAKDAADNVDPEQDARDRVKALLGAASQAAHFLAAGLTPGPGRGITPEQRAEVEAISRQFDQLTKKVNEKVAKKVKPPFEEYFFEALEHHSREGFLHLKLTDPRSYDFNRQRAWDDRLRMPQFKFAQTIRKAGESDEAFEVRSRAEEAKAREAVMTFVLGLVAEPIPPKYVHTPAGDRAAEVKGRHVLEKFNCAGCHVVRSGVVEFKPNAETLQALNEAAKAMEKNPTFQNDFANYALMQVHSSWTAPPMPADGRVLMLGSAGESKVDGAQFKVRLSQATQFPSDDNGNGNGNGGKATRQLLAGESFDVPSSQTILSNFPNFGGAFPAAVNKYITLIQGSEATGKADMAQSKLPPALLHEGERVQPEWLYKFLRNPEPVRPQTWMVLRMPKFNMSDDEARALVDYFAAVDRLNNPGIGLTYPYEATPQRDDLYWRTKNKEYLAGLPKDRRDALLADRLTQQKPLWQQYATTKRTDLDAAIKRAKDAAAQADKDIAAAGNDAAKKTAAETAKRDATAAVERLTKEDVYWNGVVGGKDEELTKEWEQTGVYSSDAYRVFLKNNNNICSSCHNIGPQQSLASKGPALDLAYQRLRPEWTARWIANPNRMVPYESVMPVNFARTKNMPGAPTDDPSTRQWFDGSAFEQILGVRDILMDYPKQADKPWNRYFRP